MQYPSFIETKLADSDALQGAVKLSVVTFEKWLESSGLPFFPEYTDHSPKHLEGVLKTAEALISDDGRNAFTAGDAAILVLAVLLHDSAMHLSEDGFLTLVQPENTQVIVSGFGDKPWPQLWEDYMAEASRFDGRRLKSLFGDTEPVHRPAMNPQDMTRRDRLLIGEFLRRHHPRLAHEIALSGVPGPDANRLRLKEVPDDFADMAGVVARSHGLPLRSCLDYLQNKHNNKREYQGVHAVYLMALLRVADYLQIEAERAPKQVLQVRRLRSPYSQREWNAHHAIRDIRNTHEDPEAIYVDAAPSDVSTYLKIKDLLAGIQGELDASWAVLGEVYGRFLSGLTLTLRRVRSNLDDEAAFAKTVNYVPCRAAFETADADLLKLLIGPLYGDKPEIGVRELMQNAVDAVRELEEYRKQRPDLGSIDLTEQEADVVISVDKDADGSHWLTVSDRGIGMTVETVRGYFLKAGASFRRSDAWRQRFEDKEGHSQVLRSGRFGVGALAAFLLGDGIHVTTRHVDTELKEDIEFYTTIDNDAIDIRRCYRPVGTTIRVQLTQQAAKWFLDPDHDSAWDWFSLPYPIVVRKNNLGYKRTIRQHWSLPTAACVLPCEWRRLLPTNYQEVHWTHSYAPTLVCNGIRIPSEQPHHQSVYKFDDSIHISKPSLSFFDSDGNLPLNLQRTAFIGGDADFSSMLRQDVVYDLLAFTIACTPALPL